MALVSCLTDAQSLSVYTDYVTEVSMFFDSFFCHLLLSTEMWIVNNKNKLPNLFSLLW